MTNVKKLIINDKREPVYISITRKFITTKCHEKVWDAVSLKIYTRITHYLYEEMETLNND